MEDTLKTLREMIPLFQKVVRPDLVDWAMFVFAALITLAIGVAAILITLKVSNDSRHHLEQVRQEANATLTEMKVVVGKVEEMYRWVLKNVLETQTKLVNIVIQKNKAEMESTVEKEISKEAPRMPPEKRKRLATAAVAATSTSISGSIKDKLAGFFPGVFQDAGFLSVPLSEEFLPKDHKTASVKLEGININSLVGDAKPKDIEEPDIDPEHLP